MTRDSRTGRSDVHCNRGVLACLLVVTFVWIGFSTLWPFNWIGTVDDYASNLTLALTPNVDLQMPLCMAPTWFR